MRHNTPSLHFGPHKSFQFKMYRCVDAVTKAKKKRNWTLSRPCCSPISTMKKHRKIQPFQLLFNIQFACILDYIPTWMHNCRKVTEPWNEGLLWNRPRVFEHIPTQMWSKSTRWFERKTQLHKDVDPHRKHYLDKISLSLRWKMWNLSENPKFSILVKFSPAATNNIYRSIFSFTFVLIWRQIENAVKFNLMPASECCVWIRSRFAAVSLINYNYYY